LLWLDGDGIKLGAAEDWITDPQGAVASIVAKLGEPWCNASYVWFFSSGHGLELDEQKRWTGQLDLNTVRVRLAFLTERPLGESEAIALTNHARAGVPQFDPAISRTVQLNFIRRPRWEQYPDRDVLGDIPTIGLVRGEEDLLEVPADLTHQAQWSHAQGHGGAIAHHPSATAAVLAIGKPIGGGAGAGTLYPHLQSAVRHLVTANPLPSGTASSSHARAIVDELRALIEQHYEQISANLAAHHRVWADITDYLEGGISDWAEWLLENGASLKPRKTVDFVEPAPAAQPAPESVLLSEMRTRVAEVIHKFHTERAPAYWNNPLREMEAISAPAELMIAPTGTGKSTAMRAGAVAALAARPDDHDEHTVVIALPRHSLGGEQIRMLKREHPAANISAAIWRGRHADDPQGPGKKMCLRNDEAKELESFSVSVDDHLCKKGRGSKAIRCPLFFQCGYQRQKSLEADLWFTAHESITHQKPKAIGNPRLMMIDENPLDAFLFGTEKNKPFKLALDALLEPPQKLKRLLAAELMSGREALYKIFSKLRTRPVTKSALRIFADGRAAQLRALEWQEKIEPGIRPDMPKEEISERLKTAESNIAVVRRAALWRLIEIALDDNAPEVCGLIQIRLAKGGDRIIYMVGLREVAESWIAPTLIADATGDAEMLRPIWPKLRLAKWPALPRPHVKVFQIMDRSIGKWAVAPEPKKEGIERKAKGARRIYAALLHQALQYGGKSVVAIVYKSTEEWIKANCAVPSWLMLTHFGDVAGTDIYKDVRALFVIGRPLPQVEAVTKQAEALSGEHIAQRQYVARKVEIPVVPGEGILKGVTAMRVTQYRHPHPLAERLRWQVCEAAIIQADGRARGALRTAETPLDIWLWTDVPVPELGPVIPKLWAQVAVGLDWQMLATDGIWLENTRHAALAYPEMFSKNGLLWARQASRSRTSSPIDITIGELVRESLPRPVIYQLEGRGCLPTRAVFLPTPQTPDPKAWLEAKLGPLSRFEFVLPETAQEAAE
jgi:hypothetical protein